MATVSPNLPLHPSFDERISVRVEGQLPDFVKQDHATFVAFLEAYYEYMEQLGKPYEIISNLEIILILIKQLMIFYNTLKHNLVKMFQRQYLPMQTNHLF